MPVFGKSSNSLFETLGRSRTEILGKKPVIPPPGTLIRPGQAPPKPAIATTAPRVPSSLIERAVDELLEVDGDPILVIDDELDVSAISPEDAVVDEPPTKILGVRADTAVVFGIGLVLVVAIAFFAGRTGKKEASVASAADAKTPAAVLRPPVQVIQQAAAPAAAPQTGGDPLDAAADDAPLAPAPAPAPAPAKLAAPPEGKYEIWVVTTSEEKAAKVVSFLNDDMLSPIYGKKLGAYAKKTGRGAQVRIKGFDKADASILDAVKDMRDPSGGGSFKDAGYHRTAKKDA
jgi:hypothetical protein